MLWNEPCLLKFPADCTDSGSGPEPDFAHPFSEFMVIALFGVVRNPWPFTPAGCPRGKVHHRAILAQRLA